MDRLAIARALEEIGRRMRIAGSDSFRAKAFLRGAEALQGQATDIDTLIREHRLRELRGIGPALTAVIEELQRTGRSVLLERLRAEMPVGVLELARVPTLTIARMRALQQALGIDSLQALEAACRAGQVQTVPSFGPRTEERLLAEIERLREGRDRLLLHRASQTAEALLEHLLASPAIERVDLAGDVRRRCETVGSFPIVASGRSAEAVVEHLLAFPFVDTISTRTPVSAAAVLTNGAPVTLDWVRPKAYGTMLVRRTGSEAHWRRLETLAGQRALSQPLADIAASDEGELYGRLGLPWIAPELREDAGEIEAAQQGRLPHDLVTAKDIRGMVHCHTYYSDGRDSVLEMARAAERLGMSYITITDHSPTASYAGGLTLDRLERQWEEIEQAQQATGVRILRGTESDILADGALDYPDHILEKLDVVIASVHSRYRMDADAMTQRVTRALSLPVFKIWGHARGRLIQRRPPFDCDMEQILDVAAKSRVAVEINGDPHRLDMDPHWIRAARQRGLPFVISVDAHSVADLQYLRYGVDMARRGWLRRADVWNTLPAAEFAARVRPAAETRGSRFPHL